MSTSERSQSLTAARPARVQPSSPRPRRSSRARPTLGLDARRRCSTAAARAADPDAALRALTRIARRDAAARARAARRPTRLARAVGAARRVDRVRATSSCAIRRSSLSSPARGSALPDRRRSSAPRCSTRSGAVDGFAADGGESAWVALRVRYRRMLARIAAYDLLSPSPVDEIAAVAAAAGGCRGRGARGIPVRRPHPGVERRGRRRAVPARAGRRARSSRSSGWARPGARELNYVSDVDVIFVAGGDDERARAGRREPHRRHRDPPRGADDARHLGRRDRAAAVGGRRQPAAGGQAGRAGAHARLPPVVLRPLGEELGVPGAAQGAPDRRRRRARRGVHRAPCSPRSGRAPPARTSSTACSGCASGSPSTSPPADVPYQLKLGPGGIRDIEFTVQLLQLVHGLSRRPHPPARHARRARRTGRPRATSAGPRRPPSRATIACCGCSSTGCSCATCAARTSCRRVPRSCASSRVRHGLADTGDGVWELWESVKREVRDIHVRLFYRPLLSAVAALPAEERSLSTAQAHDRLAAIGFTDPAGALRHIAALTSGLSRKATIQRHLMPVMIRWFADGVDPDYGLLAFRRISERLGDTPLVPPHAARLVGGGRESHARAVRLALRRRAHGVDPRVRGVAGRPRAAAPALGRRAAGGGARDPDAPRHDRRRHARRARSAPSRAAAHRDGGHPRHVDDRRGRRGAHDDHRGDDPGDAARGASRDRAARGCRARLLGHRDGPLRRRASSASGRTPTSCTSTARTASTRSARTSWRSSSSPRLRKHSEDHRVPLDLDADLRPEGRNGPLARSLDAYAEYYRRWSLSWEAQALLRARGVAGSVKLIARRSPSSPTRSAIRHPSIRGDPRDQADQGARRERAPAAGRRSGAAPQARPRIAQRRRVARAAAAAGARPCGSRDAHHLDARRAARRGSAPGSSLRPPRTGWPTRGAWRAACARPTRCCRARPATCCRSTASKLDGIGRLLGYPPRSATQVEEDYLGTTRRARRVFEKLFYG